MAKCTECGYRSSDTQERIAPQEDMDQGGFCPIGVIGGADATASLVLCPSCDAVQGAVAGASVPNR